MTRLGHLNVYGLTDDFVRQYVRLRPMTGTKWGLHLYDASWGNLDEESYRKELLLLQRHLKQVQTALHVRRRALKREQDRGREKMTFWESLAWDYLLRYLRRKIAERKSHDEYFDVNGNRSLLHDMIDTFNQMPVETLQDWQNIVSRLKRFDVALLQHVAVIKRALQRKKTVPRRQALKLAEQVERLIRENSFGEFLLQQNKRTRHVDQRFLEKLCDKRLVLSQFLRFLQRKYIPATTNQRDRVGPKIYQKELDGYLGKHVDWRSVYHRGFRTMDKILKELNDEAKRMDPRTETSTSGLFRYLATLKKLKADPAFVAQSFDEFVSFMTNLQEASFRKCKRYFTIARPDVVGQVEIMEDPVAGAGAMALPASLDGKTRGRILYSFEQRHGPYGTRRMRIPLVQEVSTAFHEGVPGHLLQSGIQLTNDRLSTLGKVVIMSSGFVEGWGLYAERLADELGMYGTVIRVGESHRVRLAPFRLGMLVQHLLRVCRLVMDIGFHCSLAVPYTSPVYRGQRWTFSMGKRMLTDLLDMTEKDADDEMTRYAAIPGQAVSYQLGFETIVRLRRQQQKRQGSRFTLRSFHDRLLQFGSPRLDTLERLWSMSFL